MSSSYPSPLTLTSLPMCSTPVHQSVEVAGLGAAIIDILATPSIVVALRDILCSGCKDNILQLAKVARRSRSNANNSRNGSVQLRSQSTMTTPPTLSPADPTDSPSSLSDSLKLGHSLNAELHTHSDSNGTLLERRGVVDAFNIVLPVRQDSSSPLATKMRTPECLSRNDLARALQSRWSVSVSADDSDHQRMTTSSAEASCTSSRAPSDGHTSSSFALVDDEGRSAFQSNHLEGSRVMMNDRSVPPLVSPIAPKIDALSQTSPSTCSANFPETGLTVGQSLHAAVPPQPAAKPYVADAPLQSSEAGLFPLRQPWPPGMHGDTGPLAGQPILLPPISLESSGGDMIGSATPLARSPPSTSALSSSSNPYAPRSGRPPASPTSSFPSRPRRASEATSSEGHWQHTLRFSPTRRPLNPPSIPPLVQRHGPSDSTWRGKFSVPSPHQGEGTAGRNIAPPRPRRTFTPPFEHATARPDEDSQSEFSEDMRPVRERNITGKRPQRRRPATSPSASISTSVAATPSCEEKTQGEHKIVSRGLVASALSEVGYGGSRQTETDQTPLTPRSRMTRKLRPFKT